ncbi:holo-ACP synthase [Candidatus Gromoviella agglomerans]|uniref:holo-ACP synthase n=1 Tax=Candidatus Gromoviella agglomerans TaxID=2806609 RepID=UPI001E3B3FCD|nr:holo-ACP synthase [Candidatus Gromoviella agglomerans]UFX98369.1 Holo-ACP synthase [Candidatus Gromoviella agglomerans]
MILGHGIDIVYVSRVKDLFVKYGSVFAQKILSSEEISNTFVNEKTISKRFAAKEAFVKAVGCGIGDLSFHDIEIHHDSFGKPTVKISRYAEDFIINKFKKSVLKNISNISILNFLFHISISDERDIAMASVIIDFN